MSRRFLIPAAVLILVGGAASAQAVTITLSSPQAGTTLHPGDALEITAGISNEAAQVDVVTVDLSLAIEGLPLPLQGRFRVRLAPNQSISRTLDVTIPSQLVLPGPVTGTLTATATGHRSGTTSTASLTLTIAP